MAEKRMFAKKVTDSDPFIEMSSAAQALYFHLNQSADDDGFSNQIQLAMMKSHASVDDLKVLLLKNFVIRFESGVIVIKHWRMHNTLRRDRYSPTSFQDELAMLNIKENLSYSLSDCGCQVVAERLPDGCPSIDKVSIDKISKEKSSIPYQQIADMYNNTCVSFPKVTTLSDKRKKAIKARLNTYTEDDFKRLFAMAEESDFLKGKNNRDWQANFDWLISDGNMAKVLDGNYKNKDATSKVSNEFAGYGGEVI